MEFKKEIVDYMKVNPKTANVYLNKETGDYFFNQPTVSKMVTVTENGKEKSVKKFEADKSYEMFSREEVLEGSDTGKKGKKEKEAK